MGRKEHLSNIEKETISFLYNRSNWPVGKIARFLGRNRRSVNRYKNYKLEIGSNIRNISGNRVKQDIQKKGNCTSCGSSNLIKAGIRGQKQRWRCKDCNYRFVYDPGMTGMTIKVKPGINEQELFQVIYNEYRDNKYLMDKYLIFKWIKKNFNRSLSKLSRYHGKSTIDMINDVMDILDKNLSTNNEMITISSE